MNPIKAIFFDVDGTLLSFQTHRIPASAKEAIRELRGLGIKVFIATGRMPAMLDVLENLEFDGYITYNGAFGITEKKEKIYGSPIPKHDLEAILTHLDNDPFPVAFMTENEITINFVNETVEEMARHVNVEVPRIQDPRLTIEEEIFQMCFYTNEAHEQKIVSEVLSSCTSTRWIDLFADINIQGTSKQAGIDRILAHYSIDRSETMAFGDGGNDISMLEHVAVGIAMGNASEKVKGIADYVTYSVDEDGIYKALEHFNILK